MTLFFVYITTEKNTFHDRMELFGEHKTLQEFFNWAESKRNLIELGNECKAVISNIKYFNDGNHDRKEGIPNKSIKSETDKLKNNEQRNKARTGKGGGL